jgi:hypothetical protein
MDQGVYEHSRELSAFPIRDGARRVPSPRWRSVRPSRKQDDLSASVPQLQLLISFPDAG